MGYSSLSHPFARGEFVVDPQEPSETRPSRLVLSRWKAKSLTWPEALRWLARLSLGLAIFLAPVRYRHVILAQPIPPVYQDYTDLLLFASDIFVLATLALWGASLLLQPRRVALGPLFMALPMGGLVLMGAASAFFSVNPLLSGYHALRFLVLAGLYLFIVNEVQSLGSILWAVAGGVYVQSLAGILQVLEQRSLGLAFLGELELDPAWSGVSIVWAEGTRSLRLYGLSDHPNILGGILATSLVLLIAWYAASQAGKILALSGVNFTGVIFTSVIFIGSLALFLTFSRSAWLGFIAGLLVVAGLFWSARQPRALREGFYLMLGAALLVAPFVIHNAAYLGVRLNAGDSFEEVKYEVGAIQERAYLNAAANEIFANHAVSGVGLGAYPIALKQARPDFPAYYQPPHNVLLAAAAETGIFGALFLFILLAGPWAALLVRRRRLDFSAALVATTGALAVVSVVGLFDYYPWLLVPGRMWLWTTWGLWAAAYQSSFLISNKGAKNAKELLVA